MATFLLRTTATQCPNKTSPFNNANKIRQSFLKVFCLLLLSLVSSSLWAQVSQSWQVSLTDIYSYSNGNNNQNRMSGIDSDANIYLAGMQHNNTSTVALKKYNKTGGLVWEKIYDKQIDNLLTNHDIIGINVDNEGNTIVLANTNTYTTNYSFNANYFTLVKYNSIGEILWDFQYSPSSNNSSLTGFDVDADGNSFIVGYNYDYYGSGNNTYLIKFDASGTYKWKQTVNSSASNGYITIPYVSADASGNIYTLDQDNGQFTIRKYTNSGTAEWSKIHTIPVGYSSAGVRDFFVDANGNCYLTGSIYSNNGLLFIAKYSTSATEEWNKLYQEGADSYQEGIRITADAAGNVYVLGRVSSMGDAALTLKYNSEGILLWNAKSNTLGINDYDNSLEPANIQVGKTGNVYVMASNRFSHSGSTDKLIKYDSNGAENWRYSIAGNNDMMMPGMSNNEILLDASENVYVKSGGGHSNDTKLSKYIQGFEVTLTSNKTSPTNGTSIPVTITFANEVTGFDIEDLVITNATIEDFSGSGKIFTVNIIPENDGTIELTVPEGIALNESGNGNAQASFSIVFDKTPPLAPKNFASASASTTNTLSWAANTESDFLNYKIYGGEDGVTGALIATVPAETLTYSHNELINGKLYMYWIVATDKAGNLSATSDTLSSTPKDVQEITFEALADKTYGDADFSPGATSSSGLSTTYTSANSNVAIIVDGNIHIVGVGSTVITAFQEGNSAYNAASVKTQTLTVNKKSISASLKGSVVKTYDGSTNAELSADNYELSGVLDGDTVTVAGSALAFDNKNVGTDKLVTVTGIVLKGKDTSKYALLATTLESTMGSITPKSLSITLNALPLITKVYDGTTTATLSAANYSVNGVMEEEEVTASGLAVYSDKNAGTSKVISVSDIALLGADKDNYTLSSTTANTTGGIVSKALTVTAEDKTKTYGETNPALTVSYNGLVNGETALSDAPAISTTATATSAAGVYDIEASGTSDNYAITFVKGKLTIAKKALTVTAEDKTKTYGEANPALTVSYNGLVNGETALSTAPAISTNATEASGTGVYDIVASGTSDNYTITFVKGELTVGKKDLTVTADDKTKTYGQANPALTVSYNGLVNGETALSTAPAISTTATAISGTGVYDIVASGTSDNYNITFVKGKLTVGKAPLTVTAEDKTKTYGEANPAFTLAYNGLVNGETALSPAPTVSTIATASSAAEVYDIEASGTSDNYNITFVKGKLTIGKAALTVTAEDKTKTYGEANPALSLAYTGLVNGETALSTAPKISTTATASSATGVYDIEASGTSNNYNITFVKGKLTIGKKALTITAEDKEKFAGTANPALTVNYSGFVNGENNSVLTTPPSINTSATINSPLGTYPIIASGASANNYEISYQNGTLTVRPGAPTSVGLASTTIYENQSAGTVAATLSSTSDDPNATFTYSLANGSGDTDNSLFAISGTEIRTASALNYEHKATYSIRVRSTTQHGFSLDKELTLTINDVNEIPTINSLADQEICYTPSGQRVNLTGITAGEDRGQTATISVSSSNSALFKTLSLSAISGQNASLNYQLAEGASGTATITVVVSDNGGRANGGVDTYSRSFTVTVNPLPVVSISSNMGTSISRGETAVLTATGGTSYQWSDASGIISGQNSASLRVRPADNTTYTVTATSAAGCQSTQSFNLEVRADFLAVSGTNVLSPNGDGVNDRLIIRNIDMYPNNVLRVYDNGGRLIYSQNNYSDQWDGTFNGSPLEVGTYFYTVDFGGKAGRLKGFITIVKE